MLDMPLLILQVLMLSLNFIGNIMASAGVDLTPKRCANLDMLACKVDSH